MDLIKEKEEILKYLEEIKDSEVLVVVEGIKDEKALNQFGIENVMRLKKPLFAVVEDIAELEVKECVLLTDLDAEGKKIYGTLKKDLSQKGVRVNNRFRNFLFRKTKLRQIEGLITYVKNLKN